MARPKKENADYFPHTNGLRNDRRCKALRSKFNLEGYAVFIMLLEILTGANHFQFENNKWEVELIAGDIDIDSKKLNAILDYLIKLGLLVKEGEIISAPILNDLKKILNEIREKDRKRKTENPTKENDTKENEVFQPENEVIRTENTQSKVNESKANERKENIKRKGVKEKTSPQFLNNFLKGEKEDNRTLNITGQASPQKEKSSAKKESITDVFLEKCKEIFLGIAPHYVWESKDQENLAQLLQKILITKPKLQTEADLAEAFKSLLQKLPDYWRTKKFTIPHLNNNYNEIVNEIRAKQQPNTFKQPVIKPILKPQPEAERPVTEEEKKKIKKDFINSICECYERFATTGEHGYMALWVMYDTLVNEKILKLTEKKLEQYRNAAIEQRKAELRNPTHLNEAHAFKTLLQNFSAEMQKGNEKSRIEIDTKTLAVQALFNELKKKKTDIKTLFKNYFHD